MDEAELARRRTYSGCCTTTLNEYVAKEVFSQAEKFFKSACVLEPVQSVMQDSVAKSREFYSIATAVALGGTKVLTELADTVWSSTKMLNAKILENASANAEATFDAAQALARAKSLTRSSKDPDRVHPAHHRESRGTEQEFFDLSARATQHVIETAQAAASKSLKSSF